jgi:PAS domain S-box-containing protein
MTALLRPTGIDVLGDIPWGTHMCSFYASKEDLLEILVPYFKAGLENNEYCLWITSDPITVDEATKAMRAALPDFDEYLTGKKIEIASHTEWYLHEGKFVPEKTLEDWQEKLLPMLENGYEGMRMNGNESWLNKEEWKDFISYEKELDSILYNRNIIVLCTYDLAKSNAAAMLDVAEVHEYTITKRSGEWLMLEVPELKQTKAQIKKQNRELEQRVAERTFELEISNKELRKEIEDHKQTETKLRAILENTDTAYVLLDTDLRILLLNHIAVDFAKQALHHYAKEGEFFSTYLPNEKKPAFQQRAEEALSGKGINYESTYPQANGHAYQFGVHMFPISKKNGRVVGIVMAISNITERKLLEQKLEEERRQKQHDITDAVITAEEKEREALGRELHDNINQILATSQLYMGVFKKRSPGHDPILYQAEKMIEKAIEEIRNLSHAMISPFVEQSGLVDALKYLVDLVEKTGEISITRNFVAIQETDMPDKLKVAIYRIVQEQLQNILKYAEAQTVVLQLTHENEKITLSIKDDGKGFDPAKKTKGIGLMNICTRAALFNAETEIISSPGKGTEIRIVFN